MIVFTTIMLVVLFAMIAFAIDIGYVAHARTELQRTADTCAMAAVVHLPDQAKAVAVAQSTAVHNHGTVGPDLDESDVRVGHWDRDTASFTSPAPSGNNTNAVRVTLRRTESHGNPLRLFFAHVLDNSSSEVVSSATAMYDRNLCGPFVGIDWLSAPGTLITDSYDSSKGPHDPSAPGDRGSLCSDGPIGLDGNAVIHGDARAGKDHSVTLEGQPTVTGSIGSRLRPLNLPPVDATNAEFNNDNHKIPQIKVGNSWVSPVDANGNLLLDGNKSIDLPAGTYYLNDMVLQGQAELNILGPVTIYLTGNFHRAGGVTLNNNTRIASNLSIIMTGGTANITSYDPFYGVVYGPNTNITIDGDSEVFGAVVGKTLTVTGNAYGHYDESLNMAEVVLPRRTALVD